MIPAPVAAGRSIKNAAGNRKRIQELLNSPLTVYGYDRPQATVKKITHWVAENPGSHADDAISV